MASGNAECDIAIIGGGLVGASLACALERLGGRTVALIEAVAADQTQARPSFD
ncbi:MAG: 2-octaprenyl-6-methoxyphenyl hydroxylase, partial [Gammaproteobacteria bacterium HGW-Gammaproteobacteria-7]